MVFRRVRGNPEPPGDQLVGGPLRQQGENLQFAGRQGYLVVHLARRGGGDDDGIRFLSRHRQFDLLQFAQDRSQAIGERGLRHIDGNPEPAIRGRFAQAKGLSPICSFVWRISPPRRSSSTSSLPTLSGPSDLSSGCSPSMGLPSHVTKTSP